MACSTEETVACCSEWQAAPAEAASSSLSSVSSCEAFRPLMLMLKVLGSRWEASAGPFTLTATCTPGWTQLCELPEDSQGSQGSQALHGSLS